ncbi:biotin synthase [Vibrio albus]|uniref:Biotin synthase n=1 Tax=Vibrio albus TaxID=2200953 RepID=A0A2U3BEM7_9VIBR|nr:type II secretion system F family protein [Vibrio albus]PWI35219.1 biotin synthase [Vibrio albus]
MQNILMLLQQGNIPVLVSLFTLLISFAIFVYVFAEQYRRKRTIKRFVVGDATGDAQTKRFEVVGKYLTDLFAASDIDVSDKLIAAGLYDTRFAYLLMPAKYIVMIVGLIVIGVVGIKLERSMLDLLPLLALWLLVVILLPDMYLAARKKRLQKKISNHLPYLLDLMGVCVQTGMTIEAAMGYLTQEMVGFDRDLAYMLKRTNERAQIVGLERALDELYKRVPTTEVRSFVMTLTQSLQYGSSIYTVLTTLAVDIREVQMLGVEEKIGKLSAKMSIPLILFIMIPIVILIAAPGVMRMMN